MTKAGTKLALAGLVLAASTLAAAAVDRHVQIHNDTGYTIYRFYSTNSGADRWGSDVMGSSVLPSGSAMNLNFDNTKGYCEFDFRIEFENGETHDEYRINVCEIGDFTFY